MAKIQTKRDTEALRKPRIFDAKLRTIGLDKQALDAQVAEREEQKKLAAVKDKAYDDLHHKSAGQVGAPRYLAALGARFFWQLCSGNFWQAARNLWQAATTRLLVP